MGCCTSSNEASSNPQQRNNRPAQRAPATATINSNANGGQRVINYLSNPTVGKLCITINRKNTKRAVCGNWNQTNTCI